MHNGYLLCLASIPNRLINAELFPCYGFMMGAILIKIKIYLID
jgi:hypothetical protein